MKPKLFNFTAYKKGRKYGGPEEGGWSYTTYRPIETIRCKGKIKNSYRKHYKEFNIFAVKPLFSNKKAKKFFEKFSDENFVIYSEKRFGDNTLLHQYYQ